ncbi:MAG: amino acid permease [Polyangiaceae bacterium]
MSEKTQHGKLGLWGATGVGVGAIVGGGILVLGGVAFRATGPSAVVAFALNGVVALLTALSFAEMSTAFPESGGAYVFAKKVLGVRAAFGVGWILWFAYIVAGVLYALGFAEYGVASLAEMWRLAGAPPPAWLETRRTVLAIALLSAGGYTLSLIRKSTGGGQFATIGKLVVFAVLILAGLWALRTEHLDTVRADLTPFFPGGTGGLVAAMGFTFIALQGFEVIAAVAGEVSNPARVLPRAMLLSLGIGLLVYIPLLLLVTTVGTPAGQNITRMATDNPETVMALTVKAYMGPVGYWLVLIAAVLSTLSALHANILAASRVALTMATDRTLPSVLSQQHHRFNTPVMAIYTTALALAAILLMVPDLASAGAAASLIFLICFALAHGTALLARLRTSTQVFRVPGFPVPHVIGGLACAALAIFQAVTVPAAGAITGVWLGLGVLLYFSLFASRAETVDASEQARDPELARLRGFRPFVLVPVANPDSAPALVELASALAPPGIGRVLLLSVIREQDGAVADTSLQNAQHVLSEALTRAHTWGHRPEALLTHAVEPWPEIARVARTYRSESLLLGLPDISAPAVTERLETLLNQVECDVAVLRAKSGLDFQSVHRVLVPVAGRGVQHELRARLIGSIGRQGGATLCFLRVMPGDTSEAARADALKALRRLAEDEAPGRNECTLVCSDDIVSAVTEQAKDADLVILGAQRLGGKKAFGDITRQITSQLEVPTVLISRRG